MTHLGTVDCFFFFFFFYDTEGTHGLLKGSADGNHASPPTGRRGGETRRHEVPATCRAAHRADGTALSGLAWGGEYKSKPPSLHLLCRKAALRRRVGVGEGEEGESR